MNRCTTQYLLQAGTFGIYLRFFANWKLDECTLALVLKSLYHLLFFALVHLLPSVTDTFLVGPVLSAKHKAKQLKIKNPNFLMYVMPGLLFMYGMH